MKLKGNRGGHQTKVGIHIYWIAALSYCFNNWMKLKPFEILIPAQDVTQLDTPAMKGLEGCGVVEMT